LREEQSDATKIPTFFRLTAETFRGFPTPTPVGMQCLDINKDSAGNLQKADQNWPRVVEKYGR